MSKLRGAAARAKTKAQLSSALSAILDDEDESNQSNPTVGPSVLQVLLAQLYPNTDQPRRQMDPEAISRLAVSIKHQGLLQPILVSSADTEGRRMIIAGERRFRAMQHLGRESIAAIEYDASARDESEAAEHATAMMAELALVENLEREDLTVVETAFAYQNMMRYHGHNQSSLARALGVRRHDILRHVKILELPEDILEVVAQHRLSKTAAYLLAEFEHPEDARSVLPLLIAGEISTTALRSRVQRANRPEAEGTAPEAAPLRADRFDFKTTFRRLERSLTAFADVKTELTQTQRNQLRGLHQQLEHILAEDPED